VSAGLTDLASADLLGVSETMTVLARAFSDGRRTNARLVYGPAGRYRTNLKTVYLPFEADADQSPLVCGVALQASPTKEIVADLPVHRLSRHVRNALVWEEGRAAGGWITERWPGLTPDLERLLPEVAPTPPPGDGRALLDRAVNAAKEGRSAAPLLLGALPGRGIIPARRWFSLERARQRMPWSLRQLEDKTAPSAIPIGGSGGHQAPRNGPPPTDEEEDELTYPDARVGIPYDEWDYYTASYREGHVTVFERDRAAGATNHMTPNPALTAWFRKSPSRRWARRLDDGTDVDIDAYVACCAERSNDASRWERLYAEYREASRDVAVAILLDLSASLDASKGRALDVELQCADALACALEHANHDHAIFAFTGDTRHRVDVQVLRSFDQGGTVLPGAAHLHASGYTRLGAPIRHVARRLLKRSAERHVLIMIGDGLPSDEGYEGQYAEEDVRKAVEELTSDGIVCFYIGVGSVRRDPLPAMFGDQHFCRTDDPDVLPLLMRQVYEELAER
jgi:nitric oxide reductase NorD protein